MELREAQEGGGNARGGATKARRFQAIPASQIYTTE